MLRLREEHNFTIRNLNSQIEKKNSELDRMQREKGDILSSLNEKVISLQDLTRNNQDTYSKRNNEK